MSGILDVAGEGASLSYLYSNFNFWRPGYGRRVISLEVSFEVGVLVVYGVLKEEVERKAGADWSSEFVLRSLNEPCLRGAMGGRSTTHS